MWAVAAFEVVVVKAVVVVVVVVVAAVVVVTAVVVVAAAVVCERFRLTALYAPSMMAAPYGLPNTDHVALLQLRSSMGVATKGQARKLRSSRWASAAIPLRLPHAVRLATRRPRAGCSAIGRGATRARRRLSVLLNGAFAIYVISSSAITSRPTKYPRRSEP